AQVAFTLLGAFALGLVWSPRHPLLRFHAVGLRLLAVGGAVYMALPRMMFASYMADQGLPIALAFLLIACLDVEMRHRLVRRGFLALLLIVLLVRVTEVNLHWASLASNTLQFRDPPHRINGRPTRAPA